MRSPEEFFARIKGYTGCQYYYHPEIGYIAWQCSTGDNIEIVFIEAKQKGQGNGIRLIKEMLKKVQPYHSIFVFRRANNITAKHFYIKMGFQETRISGLYQGEDAVLGVASYSILKHNLGI